MKSGRRRPIQKAITPKGIADQFRDLQKLQAKVSQAELADAQKKASVETKVKGNGGSPPGPPSGRGRTRC
jgi:hypothetical protein